MRETDKYALTGEDSLKSKKTCAIVRLQTTLIKIKLTDVPGAHYTMSKTA